MKIINKYKNTIVITLSGIILGLLLYFIFGRWLQPFTNSRFQSVSDQYRAFQILRRAEQIPRLPDLRLASEDSLMVESLYQPDLPFSISSRIKSPLMGQIEETVEDYPTLDQLDEIPWFYFSPTVEPLAEKSAVNEYQLIQREPFNDFGWYLKDGQHYLMQSSKRYTGFFPLENESWRYFEDGRPSDVFIDGATTRELLKQRHIMTGLVPVIRRSFFFVEPLGGYNQLIDYHTVNYPILYLDTENIILTSPPGTLGSRLLTSTESFYEMPMDVIAEVTTLNGTWLQIKIGRDEFGWVPKDPTYTSYKRTYYSEEVLLDVIESVLEEEIAAFASDAGASFINHETMGQVSANNQLFFPASTQKIYVLGEVYRQYRDGWLDPYESIVEMWASDIVPGAGIIQGYPVGSTFTIDELVDLVAIYSDNVAANLLIDAVGGGAVMNPNVQKLGMVDTYVSGKYYDYDGYLRTTPADAARFFALIANNRVNGEPYDELLINKFRMNTHTYIRSSIPGTTDSWNKSGIGGTEQNDVASFVTPYGAYSLAVFTANPAHRGQIQQQMADLSRRVHDVYNELRSDLWLTYEE